MTGWNMESSGRMGTDALHASSSGIRMEQTSRPSSASRSRPRSVSASRRRAPSIEPNGSYNFDTSGLGLGMRIPRMGAPLSTTSISSGGVLSRPIADAQVRALAETLNQTTARAEKHEQTTDMLRHTLKDLRRELRDKSRRLEEAHSAMDVIRAESDALRHRASTDDATIRRLQARVDLLESLGRKDGTTGELRRLEHRLADTTVALEDAREAQRAAQALAATQAEQLKVLRAALDLGEEELGVGFSAATTARDAGDGGQPVGRLLYAVARAREDNSGLAIRLSETTRAARAAEGRAREAEAALEEARSENARLKGERGALETAVASLEAELDSTVARAVAAEGRVQDMGERMQQLEDDFMERDSEARRLRGEVERVRGDVEREVEVAGVEAQRRAQAEMGQRMEEQSSRYEQELRSKDDTIRVLRNRLDETTESLENLRNEFDTLQASMGSREQEEALQVRALGEDLERARGELMDARERERRAREEIGNLHAQIDAQRAELEERWAGRREERGGAAAPEAARAVRPGGGVHDGAAAHGAMAVRVRDLEAQLNAARHKLSLADMENRARLTRVLEDYRVAIDAKADLEAETSTLRSRVGHLEGENKSLRADVERLRQLNQQLRQSKWSLQEALRGGARSARPGTAPEPNLEDLAGATAAPAAHSGAYAPPLATHATGTGGLAARHAAAPQRAPESRARAVPLFPPDGHSYSAKFEARSTAVAAAAVAAGAEGESAGRGRPQGEGDPSGPRSRQGAAWSGGSETRPIGGTPAGAGARDVGGGVESQDGRSSAGVRRGEGAAGMADAGASGADSARWSTQSVGTATRADAGAGAAWGKEEKGGDGRGSHVAVKAPKRPVVSVPSSPSRLGSTLPAAGQPSSVSGMLDDVDPGETPRYSTFSIGVAPRKDLRAGSGRGHSLVDIASGRVG